MLSSSVLSSLNLTIAEQETFAASLLRPSIRGIWAHSQNCTNNWWCCFNDKGHGHIPYTTCMWITGWLCDDQI